MTDAEIISLEWRFRWLVDQKNEYTEADYASMHRAIEREYREKYDARQKK